MNLDEQVGALWPAEEAEGQPGTGNEATQIYSPPPTGRELYFMVHLLGNHPGPSRQGQLILT